jgi:hypothetical protein
MNENELAMLLSKVSDKAVDVAGITAEVLLRQAMIEEACGIILIIFLLCLSGLFLYSDFVIGHSDPESLD